MHPHCVLISSVTTTTSTSSSGNERTAPDTTSAYPSGASTAVAVPPTISVVRRPTRWETTPEPRYQRATTALATTRIAVIEVEPSPSGDASSFGSTAVSMYEVSHIPV